MLAIISQVHVATYVWFWSDKSQIDLRIRCSILTILC